MSQLQSVLRARGVQLPAYQQTQSFYLDLCRKHGINDVPASELDGGGGTAQQSAMTPVRNLSVSQLQSVLRARGVQLPAYQQTQSFYLDLCRKHGVTEVPTSELAGGGVSTQQAMTPVRDLSVSQLRTVLGTRGVQLPAYTQTQSFYLDLCRKHGVTEVPTSELAGGGVSTQQAMTPLRDLSVSQLQSVLRARGVQLPANTQSEIYYRELCRKHGINEVATSELAGVTSAGTQQAMTPVRDLSVSQLQTILRERGVQLPAYQQTQSFYLDLCRKHGITEVPTSELVDGGGSHAATSAMTPVRDLSVEQLKSVLRARGVQLPLNTQTQIYYLELCRKHGVTEVPTSEIGGGAPAASSSRAMTPVRDLSVTQLQNVLRARGVQLPVNTQTEIYYREMCRKHGINEVPTSELAGATSSSSCAYTRSSTSTTATAAVATAQPYCQTTQTGTAPVAVKAQATPARAMATASPARATATATAQARPAVGSMEIPAFGQARATAAPAAQARATAAPAAQARPINVASMEIPAFRGGR